MSKIIRAVAILVILYFLNDYFRFSMFASVINIAFIAAFIYLIVAVIGLIRNPPASNIKEEKVIVNPANTYAPNVNPGGSGPAIKDTPARNAGGLLLFGIIVITVLIILLREVLGQFSFGVFAFIDSLLKLSEGIPPFVAWALPGLMVGAIFGSAVAWKKYNLSFVINFIPIGGLILTIVILFMINKPTTGVGTDNLVYQNETKADSAISLPSRKFLVNRWVVVDVLGKNRSNFQRRNNEKSELEFKKNGKCYLNENGVRKMVLYYTLSDNGRFISFSNPNNNAESRQIEIISVTKNDMVIRSELFQNDTAILKSK